MFIVLTYDIEISENGNKRLRKVSKICQNYGVRVRNSVFELNINCEQLIKLKNDLQQIIDEDVDSIRIYNFGNTKRNNTIEVLGKKEKIEISIESSIIL